MLRIGHRGAKGFCMENTLESIEKALELNCDIIEIDIQKTLDDHLVVFHDTDLIRLAKNPAKINELTHEQIKSIALADNSKIPTLEQVIDKINKKVVLNIEIKTKGLLPELLNTLEVYFHKGWNHHNFIISSFYWQELEQIHLLSSELPLALLTEKDPLLAIDKAIQLNAYAINPLYTTLDKHKVKVIQQNALKVFPYTVNSTNDILLMKQLKVDGIISDYPDRV